MCITTLITQVKKFH